jgi:SAM-dependent methyltransferase
MSFYTQFAETYEAVFSFLRQHLPGPPARVLDVGCGTGHYSGALAAQGYDTTGIDLDPAMIAHAQERYPAAAFHVMNMLDIAELGRTFDGVACIGNTAAHLTRAEFAGFVETVRGATAPGGPWVLQVMNWDYVLTRDVVTFPVIEGEGDAVFHRAYRDITESRVTFTTRLEVAELVIFEDAVPLYPMRSAEVIALHEAAGFRLVKNVGSYGGAAFDPDTFSANLFVFR